MWERLLSAYQSRLSLTNQQDVVPFVNVNVNVVTIANFWFNAHRIAAANETLLSPPHSAHLFARRRIFRFILCRPGQIDWLDVLVLVNQSRIESVDGGWGGGEVGKGGGGKKKPPVETVVLEEDDLNVEGLSLDDE